MTANDRRPFPALAGRYTHDHYIHPGRALRELGNDMVNGGRAVYDTLYGVVHPIAVWLVRIFMILLLLSMAWTTLIFSIQNGMIEENATTRRITEVAMHLHPEMEAANRTMLLTQVTGIRNDAWIALNRYAWNYDGSTNNLLFGRAEELVNKARYNTDPQEAREQLLAARQLFWSIINSAPAR